MKIWQKEKISVEKLQKKLNLRESKRLDVLLNEREFDVRKVFKKL